MTLLFPAMFFSCLVLDIFYWKNFDFQRFPSIYAATEHLANMFSHAALLI